MTVIMTCVYEAHRTRDVKDTKSMVYENNDPINVEIIRPHNRVIRTFSYIKFNKILS